jgi:thiamine phosphate synthase YjbQ (UPF0047 family)
MASHARSILTSHSLAIPVSQGKLGTRQGVYLYEGRRMAHKRSVVIAAWGN